MTTRTRELLHHALQLRPGERAELAAELLSSLDGGPDADVEAAWAKEIERRVLRFRGEGTPGQDWASVRSRLLKKYFPNEQ